MAVDTYAERLFHRYYLCTVPAYDYYDPRFIAKFGMHQHPNADVARAMLKDEIHEQMCPAMMASWVADGVKVSLVDPSDSVKVFKDLMGHIADWRDYIESRPLFLDLPLEGLFEFHMLAKHIYQLAREHGLGGQNRRRIKQQNRMLLMRNVTMNRNENPFNFKFNGAIWDDLLFYAEAAGYRIKKFREADDVVLDRIGDSGQSTLGSSNVNFANRYHNSRKP